MMFSDNSIQRIQSSVHVEQLASVDPNVSQKKQQSLRTKKNKRRRKPDEDFEEQSVADVKNDDSDHIDYRA